MSGLLLTVIPDEEPVTLVEAKSHMRVDHADDDTLIGVYIASARDKVETFIKRRLLTQTYEYYIDGGFPGAIRLPEAPVQSVTSIKYIADDGTETTLAADQYRTSLVGMNPTITPSWGYTWPATRNITDAVKVTFKAGYTDVENVPAAIKQAALMLIAHYYENREAAMPGTQELPLGVRNLLVPFVRYS